MNIAIVEDEAVIARRLERMVRTIIGGEAAIQIAPTFPIAQTMIRSAPIDLLFLDLNLNGQSGFRLLEEAAAKTLQTIIVSAHHDQALRAFDYGVTDFVAKPWSEERLRIAIERATSRSAQKIVVRKGRELRTIVAAQIVFIRGADDYSELHLDDGTVHLHEKSLTALEAILPPDFARVHRSFIANFARVRGVRNAALVFESGAMIPVGRMFRERVRELIISSGG